MLNDDVRAYQQLGVSNSEVSSFSTCELAWFFGSHPAANLRPKTQGPALTRGILGHGALEIFYKGMQKGDDFDSSAQAALSHIQDGRVKAALESDFDKVKILNQLYKLIEGYFEYYGDDGKHWEILGVESFYKLEWEESVSVYLPMRLDAVIYQKGGKFKGEISPLDHKFTNDFWHDWKYELNSQFPLYIKALRSTTFRGKLPPVVRRAIVNLIRTREVKEPQAHDTYLRVFPTYDKTNIEFVYANHLKVAKKISILKRMPGEVAIEKVAAVWGSPNCQFCQFKSLCITRLKGGRIESTIQADYEPSTYGYPSLEELEDER